MKSFILNDIEIKFSNTWEDLTIKQWVLFYKLNSKKEEEDIQEDFYLLSILEILCNVLPGELDDLPLAEYQELISELTFLLQSPEFKESKNIEIDGVIYGFPKSFDNLTTGEYISIKTLQSKYKNNLDAIPTLLSVILRPVTKVVDEETKQEEWVQDKFDTKNLSYRADLINEKVKAVEVMKGINFFFHGS